MRGKVISYKDLDGSGLISGDDGQRYSFTRGDLSNVRMVSPGTEVDFEPVEGKATSVYIMRSAYTGQVGDKNKIAAALLALFIGGWGVHKFYLGMPGAGVIMLLCGTLGWLLVLPGVAMVVISFVEFIIYLTKSDDQFYQDYVVGKREWF